MVGGTDMKGFGCLARALVFLAFLLHPASVHPSDLESAWRISFVGPLPHWQAGLPIGNGQIGAQSWGTGQQLFLTLDRGDVWDLRYQNNTASGYTYRRLRELVQAGRTDLVQPVGRLLRPRGNCLLSNTRALRARPVGAEGVHRLCAAVGSDHRESDV
jgi:hypothetical protein